MTATSASSTGTAALHPRIQELIDYIDVHRRELRDAIASVPEKMREIKPADGSWSVAEVLEHVSMLEQQIAALVTMHVTAARASGVGPDPDTSSVVASFANPGQVVDRGTKIVAPKSVVPTGTVDAQAGTVALEQSRTAMVASLHNANGVSLENLVQTHFVLGPRNLYHWIVATALHDSRHAAQIRELGKSLVAS
ncbi:MAG: DinB family protein [Gemmatimonadota bacterium]